MFTLFEIMYHEDITTTLPEKQNEIPHDFMIGVAKYYSLHSFNF